MMGGAARGYLNQNLTADQSWGLWEDGKSLSMLVSNMLHEGFSTETQGKEITPEKEQRPKVLMTLSDFKGDSQNRVIAILAWPIF